MPISTLLVCEQPDKQEQLQSLIGAHPEFAVVGVVSKDSARREIAISAPDVVWLELAPEPLVSLALLGDLKEMYPKVIFVVSHSALQADLVKSAMQLGALEYFDPESIHRLLPDAIERIHQKLESNQASATPPRIVEPITENLPSNPNPRPVTGVREFASQVEGGPDSMPIWVIPAVLLVLAIIGAFITFSHH